MFLYVHYAILLQLLNLRKSDTRIDYATLVPALLVNCNIPDNHNNYQYRNSLRNTQTRTNLEILISQIRPTGSWT